METKRFYRSSRDIHIAGVCGGLAEYFDVDPILIRILFVILALFGGSGVLIYLILWFVVPRNPEPYYNSSAPGAGPGTGTSDDNSFSGEGSGTGVPPEGKQGKGGFVAGIILITLGTLFLIDEFVPHINFGQLWPIILIVIGGILLVGATSQKKN